MPTLEVFAPFSQKCSNDLVNGFMHPLGTLHRNKMVNQHRREDNWY
jgi:hypothetical protein